jgi:preprotein translocase subunit SecD
LFYLPIDPGSSAVSTKEISVPDEAAPPHGYFFCLEKTVSPHNPEEEAYRLFCVSQHVGLDGSSIASAKALPSFYDKGRWEVDVMFNSRGGRTFSDLTKRCIGKKLAIVLDNVVIFAPVVHEEVNSPSCRITGNFTKVEGEGLTLALNSGPLPYTGEIVKKRFITGRK